MITPQERRDLIEKLESQRDALLEQIKSLPVERLTSRWKEGDRTPMGMLLHVITAERMYRDDWARRAREESEPDVRRQAQNSGQDILFEEANQLSREELLERILAERIMTLRFIAETSDAEFDRKGCNTPFGDLTIHQFLKSLYRHDQMHVDEIAGTPSKYVITTQDGRRL